MAGHNKWSQIKHQKGAADKKRSIIFSKILRAITIAARAESNPDFNPRLRSLIDEARTNAIPNENIERAIQKTKDNESLEELSLEAYGPNGIAFIIEIATDSRNRTVNEIRHLLEINNGKLAEQGSVRWAFEGSTPKFPIDVIEADRSITEKIVDLLEDRDDVQNVATNLKPRA
jgi:YebC/PmpR family DNA-binding regulatory protein